MDKDYYVYVYWYGLDGGPGEVDQFSSFKDAWKNAEWLLSKKMGYGRDNNEVVIRGIARKTNVQMKSLIKP